jgi:serine/threonine protein phosphatase PrpC
LRDRENPIERITKYVAAQIVIAIGQAHSRIEMMGKKKREFDGSATTLSFAKLMELPDGNGGRLQRLFFANIGDSRIYVQRTGGVLTQITRDDSQLQQWVNEGELTAAEAELIDQAPDPQLLNPQQKRYNRSRAVITNSVGIGNPTENLKVAYLDLQPGDRFVIVSDGVCDQMPTDVIGSTVGAQSDDGRAETALQQDALNMSREGRHPRAKGDDISALVKTIATRGPDRRYLHPVAQPEQSTNSLKMNLQKMRERREAAQQEVQKVEAQLALLDAQTPGQERLALLLKLEKAKQHVATYAYHLEKTQLDIIDAQTPPRYQTGEQFHMWREDFDPPSFDHQAWTVESYDALNRLYAVRGAGGTIKKISRYELEIKQPGQMFRLEDELSAVNEDGILERGFKVVGIERDGRVTLAKERDGVIKRVVAQAEDVNESFFAQVYVAERSRQRMVQAMEMYHASVKQEKAFLQQRDEVAQREQRQQAFNAIQGEG